MSFEKLNSHVHFNLHYLEKQWPGYNVPIVFNKQGVIGAQCEQESLGIFWTKNCNDQFYTIFQFFQLYSSLIFILILKTIWAGHLWLQLSLCDRIAFSNYLPFVLYPGPFWNAYIFEKLWDETKGATAPYATSKVTYGHGSGNTINQLIQMTFCTLFSSSNIIK